MSMEDSFLLDEVRCGFMIPSTIKQAWAAELEVLMEINRVCKKHNIQYFADWGTLLGAVRHGGFVPWDDDLDIVMKREDYIKFMTVARFDMEDGFDVQTFRNHDDCWLFMGKVVGRNGFCFEKEHLRRFHNFQYIASVDIFVLDYVYRDPEKEEKRRTLCKYMLGVADSLMEEGLSSQERERRLKTVEEMYGQQIRRINEPLEMRRYLYGEIEKIFGEVPEQEADKLTQLFPWGLKGKDFQFPKEYYDKEVYLPFEYTYMPVPMMYDKMLRQRYGEYCRIVKEWAAHDYPFFEGQKKNLQKVLDFELPEFKAENPKLFRSEAEEICKNLSYKVMAGECIAELWRMKDELSWTVEQMASQPACVEKALDLLSVSQQLAIDLGNMIEQFLGEGCNIVLLLEGYCESLYRIYEQIQTGMNESQSLNADVVAETEDIVTAIGSLHELQRAISADVEQNVFKRKTVLFLPVLARDWDSLHGLWQSYVKDPLCDVYVLPLPYYYKDYDGAAKKVCYEAGEFPEDVPVLDYNLLTTEYLEMLHPETIVIQNPYDSWNPVISVPEMFYSLNLRKYTDELIYVPPFKVEEYTLNNEREYSNMRYYVTMPGIVYADRVAVQSENMRQVYIERLAEFVGGETRELWEKRVSVLEVPETDELIFPGHKDCDIESGEERTLSKKKMLYGISFGAYVADIDAGQAKIERNLQLFEECREQIELTIMIYPHNEATASIKEDIRKVLEKYPGMRAMTECTEKDFDAYYGDVMPLMMEFREAGKPVMVQDYDC